MAIGSKLLDLGQGLIADLLDLNTRSSVAATYFGLWGSGGATPTVADAGPGSENPEARTSIPAGSMSQVTTQSTGDTVQWVYIIVATGSRTVQETLISTLSAAGVYLLRIVHGSLTFESGDQTTYTVRLQVKDTSE